MHTPSERSRSQSFFPLFTAFFFVCLLAVLATDAFGQMPQPSGQAFLDPDQAFAFQATVKGPSTIEARWKIADGYYLYRDKMTFSLAGDGVRLGSFNLPAGEKKNDKYFGVLEIFHDSLSVLLPVERDSAEKLPVTLTAVYQGCAEGGICYPPITREVALVLPPQPSTRLEAPPQPQGGVPENLSEQDRLARALAGNNIIWTLATFFGLGLLLSLTPCIFPMIPILSGIIVGQGDAMTTRRAFLLSLVYVLAMSVAYTIVGILAGLFGANLQAAFQNPWGLGLFALVFVLLALSMFGFYDLQVPSAWQTRLDRISRNQQGGRFAGVAVMGFLSAIIVGPCVAPPLMGALIYIGKTGDALLGGTALFFMSLGMGALLLVVGTTAGKYMPRAGGWLDAVKAFFGVLLLAVAIWLLDRILPGQVTMFLWAALLVFSGIYLGALDSLSVDVPGWKRFWKGCGILVLVYGLLLLIGAAAGTTNPLAPLAGFQGNGSAAAVEEKGLAFTRIKTVADLRDHLSQAAQGNKTVMLDFYADWCVSCKELEHITFVDPRVKQLLSQTILLQADVTANDAQDKELLRHFGLIGPPAVLFFGPDGKEREKYRLVGFLGPDRFHSHAQKALMVQP